MSAGLPATGLGGALYLVLIIWMLSRQLASTARGNRSEASQWPFTGKMVVVAMTMVAVAIGETMLIYGARKLAISNMPALANVLTPRPTSFIVVMAAMPFILLVPLMACLHCLRLAFGVTKPKRQGYVRAPTTALDIN
jgi:hypothetical protein